MWGRLAPETIHGVDFGELAGAAGGVAVALEPDGYGGEVEDRVGAADIVAGDVKRVVADMSR